jgi:para-aminobenzoate synthetase/4-amino-4-deoxychorismate lyase
MTSTVTATMRRDVKFPEVLHALFPCGSITGAPKLHTMDLISNLEDSPRGLYCGAIGWVDAPTPESPAGDFCLSVAIRTLVLGVEQAGRRTAMVGVGNGIVQDSDPQDEFAEVRTKLRYLTTMDPGFTLFETMRVNLGKLRHLKHHLQRLRASASGLGFALDEAALQNALAEQLNRLDASQSYRLRLDLHHDGRVKFQTSLLVPMSSAQAQLLLAKNPVPVHEAALLNHKTSLRKTYDAAIRTATEHHAFDVIFLNPLGEVTEGARSTLFAKINGEWCTPAIDSGVLAGVMRWRLLQRFPNIRQRVLALDEVLSADQIAICSALRGLRRAVWMPDAEGKPMRV